MTGDRCHYCGLGTEGHLDFGGLPACTECMGVADPAPVPAPRPAGDLDRLARATLADDWDEADLRAQFDQEDHR